MTSWPKLFIISMAIPMISHCSSDDDGGDEGGGENQSAQVNVEQQKQQGILQPDKVSSVATTKAPTLNEALEIVSGVRDIEAPAIPKDQGINISSVKADRFEVSWQQASDNETKKSDLRYLVYLSTANNIDTIAKAELNGIPFETYKKGIGSKSIAGLAEGTKYYVMVVVKDAANNISSYKISSTTTTYFPVPGGSGLLAASHDDDDVVVTWTEAVNGGGNSSANLKYSLYTSATANLGSVEDVLENGTLYGAPISENGQKVIEDPGPSTRLFYNVIVSDSAGNLAAYQQNTFDTNPEVFISYVDNTNRDLKFVSYTTGAWNSPETVESAGDFYAFQTSIKADANSVVHIAAYESVGRDLWYANNSSGSFVTETAASAGNIGQYPSLTLTPAGDPYITAYDGSARDMIFYFEFGGSWASQPSYAHPNAVGLYTSLLLDNAGKAHAVSYDSSSDDLNYSTNESGAWVTSTIDSGGDVGSYCYLAIDNAGNLHASYYDLTNTALKYATNATGSWVLTTVDNTASQGLRTSVDVASDGRVFISYYSTSLTSVMLAILEDGVWSIEQVDGASGTVGSTGIGIALDGLDRPHLSYQRSTGSMLVHATRSTPSSPWVYTEVDADAVNNVGRESSIDVK